MGVEYHRFCRAPLSTKSLSKGDSDTHQGFGEVRDPCCGCSGAADPGQPGIPPHHWRADDACGVCVGWDLLWVVPDDAVVNEMTIVAMQGESER